MHHIDPGHEPIRQEIVTRLQQSAYVPAIGNDIAGDGAEKKGLAQQIDVEHHAGLPPLATYVARTAFIHTLAFNEQLKGLTAEELRYSMLGPATDLSFIEEARKRFIAESEYLDDRPGAPMRFLAEANLAQVMRRAERHVDADDARAWLKDRITEIFGRREFEPVIFAAGPFDVDDDAGDGAPILVVLSYDAVTVGSVVDAVPELIRRICTRKGAEGAALRSLRNNVVFVVADDHRKEEMRRRTVQRLALRELKKPERLQDLAEYQQAKVRELEARSEQDLAIAVQQCYRHVFYPSRDRVGASDVDLAHTAIDMHSTSDKPGAGQRQIVRALRDLSKLQSAEDEPYSPTYVRDRTPLKKGQITTRMLRDEFRRDPALPILIGDDIFIRGIRRGVERGEYVYQKGELLYGPGDPVAQISIDEESVVSTMAYAKNTRLWPRKPKDGGGGTGARGGTGAGGDKPGPGTDGPGTDGPGGAAGGRTGEKARTPEPGTESFTAEGVLKEALVRLWEQARTRKVEQIGHLTIRMFEAGDGFRLLGPIGAVSGAAKTVRMEGGYETREGGEFMFEFSGPVQDAQPVREFIEPQLRDGEARNLDVRFELAFTEGLAMRGDAAEKLTERLTRFASGAAWVSATAEGKRG